MIEILTLGVLALTRDGEEAPAELRWRKNSALLIYLARSPGRTRMREHLCGLLWPEKPESAARHSLNEALRILRKALGEGAIEADARQVTLLEGVVGLDTEALEAASEREDWQEAACLVGGEFLEGFGLADASGFEDWLAAERTLWRGRAVRALLARAESLLGQGDVAEGRELAQRALALDPFSDLAAQVGVRALALGGDRGGALVLYEDFVKRLRQELGAAPAPETERLADRVRRERTWRLPAALAGENRSPGRIELLGREEDLARPLAAWGRCRSEGRAALILLEGEPGVGKTRLLEELAGRARLDGGTVAGIRSVPADCDLDGSGLRGLCTGGLLEAPGLLGAPAEALAALTAEIPGWLDRLGDPEDDVEPSPLARAFSDVMRAICEEQPTFLFVDDAEWLDARSRDALVLLLRDLERNPIAVALASWGPEGRDAFDELQSSLGAEGLVERVSVPCWPEEACAALVARTLPEFEAGERDRLARRIFADSAGLPLLAVSLAFAVRDGLSLDEGAVGSAWPAADRTLEHTMPGDLPDTVRAAIRVGFRRLSKPAQAVLTAASLLGARFDPHEAARLADLSAADRDSALDELEWLRWLVAEPRGYAFVARIVRDIVADDMLTPGRRRRFIEQAAAGPPSTELP